MKSNLDDFGKRLDAFSEIRDFVKIIFTAEPFISERNNITNDILDGSTPRALRDEDGNVTGTADWYGITKGTYSIKKLFTYISSYKDNPHNWMNYISAVFDPAVPDLKKKLLSLSKEINADLAKRKKINELRAKIPDGIWGAWTDPIKSSFDTNKKLRSDIDPYEFLNTLRDPTDPKSTSFNILKKLSEEISITKDSDFHASVLGGTTQEFNEQFPELDALYNNDRYMGAAQATRDAINPKYRHRHGKEIIEKESFKLKRAEVVKDEGFVPDLVNVVLSPFTNLFDFVTFHQVQKWAMEFKARGKGLLHFAKTYFPAEYLAKFDANERRKMEKKPESYNTLWKIRGLFRNKIKDVYSSPEKFNEIAIKIKKAHKGKLDSKEAKADFDTWGLIGRRFLNPNPLMRYFGWTTFGYLFENEDSKMQRRSLQYAEAGGDWEFEVSKTVDSAKKLVSFLDKMGASSILGDSRFKPIKDALDALKFVEDGTLSETDSMGNFIKNKYKDLKPIYFRNKVYDAIQKADLSYGKNHDLLNSILMVAQKAKLPSKEMDVILRHVNHLVSGVSRHRVKWWHFKDRIFPKLGKGRKDEADRAEITYRLNRSRVKYLHSVAKDDPLYGTCIPIENHSDYEKEMNKLLENALGEAVLTSRGKGKLNPRRHPLPILRFDHSTGRLINQKELRRYFKPLMKDNTFEEVMASQQISVEEKTNKSTRNEIDQKRKFVTLADGTQNSLGMLHDEAFRGITGKAGNAALNLDIKDKAKMEKLVNNYVSELSNNAYLKMEEDAGNLGIDETNIPYYIALMNMGDDFNIYVNNAEKATESKRYSKDMQKEIDISKSRINEVSDLIKKLKTKNVYRNDSSFGASFEETIEDHNKIRNWATRYRGTKTYADNIMKENNLELQTKADDDEKSALEKQAEKLKTQKEKATEDAAKRKEAKSTKRKEFSDREKHFAEIIFKDMLDDLEIKYKSTLVSLKSLIPLSGKKTAFDNFSDEADKVKTQIENVGLTFGLSEIADFKLKVADAFIEATRERDKKIEKEMQKKILEAIKSI